jgi:very-short-patch-repair endonuclease
MRRIVRGQHVEEAKVTKAREMRRQMTKEERLLWQGLRANRFLGLQFRRQQIIDGFIVDFHCHAAGLIVEVDGGIHEKQEEYDQERDRILSARGLKVARVTNDEIERDLPGVLTRIMALCGYEF